MLWDDIPDRENGIDHIIEASWFNTMKQAGIDNAGSNTVGFGEIPTGVINGVNLGFDISKAPSDSNSLLVMVNGVALLPSEWSYLAPTITLTTAPVAGQVVSVFYLTEGAASAPVVIDGTQRRYYHIVTAGEISSKELTLASTPAIASYTFMDIIGGSSQHYGTDFVVSGTTLSWNGYALDGVLNAGDVLRIDYLE